MSLNLQSQQDKIFKLIKKILRSRKINKIVQGIDYEYSWTKAQFNITPNSIVYDTRLATHVLDNRIGVTGLKFQAFRRWGIRDYNTTSQAYIKTNKNTGFNDMLRMPVDALLNIMR